MATTSKPTDNAVFIGSGTLDLDLALCILLNQVVTQTGVDAARIFLCDVNHKDLRFAACHGFYNGNIVVENIQYGDGLAGYVALRRRPFLTADLSHPSHSLTRESYIEHEQFITYCGVPLICEECLHGVMEVFFRQPFEVDRKWFASLTALTERIAFIIDSAERFDHMLSLNNEAGIFQLSSHLRSSL